MIACIMGGSPGELSEEFVMQEKRKKGWRINCDVGEATESLDNEQSSDPTVNMIACIMDLKYIRKPTI